MFSSKYSQEKVSHMKENRSVIKLTKKQRLKKKKFERKENMVEQRHILMREHLQRELKYGLYTQKRHEMNWERMLRQITLPHHREELEYTWQAFERLMDTKNFIISRLMDEIRQQEEQYLMCVLLHVSKVDGIMSMFHGELQELHDDFELNLLKSKHHEFLHTMDNTNVNSTNQLKSILYGMEIEGKGRERSRRADICSKVDYETDDKQGATLELRDRLIVSFENMLKKTNEIQDQFLTKTRKRRHDYDTFKTQEDKVEELLANEVEKIQHLREVIRKLKKKEDDIGHNELANLEGERRFFKRAFLILELKLVADLKLDKAKTVFFVRKFYEAYENVNKFLKRGVNMMHILRCTRKLETSEEKARPYPIFRNIPDHMKQRKFFLFWQRVGKVDASRTALMEERNSLLLENELLERKIAEICSCLSCPSIPPICHREGPIPFTDGMTVMKKYKALKEVRRK